MPSIEWLTTDRLLAVVGLAVTVLGTAVAVWQLLRTRRAAEAARTASQATRAVLRAADLRRVLDTSLELGKRLNQSWSKDLVVLYLGDWLVGYQRVQALVRGTRGLPVDEVEALLDRIEQARGEVLVAREAAEGRRSWAGYSPGPLRRVLLDYGAAAERLLVASENEESVRHAV